ncbi:MAG: DUF2339 domain-containing protein [Denitromonas halophila]|nr:MAG: DUF2339 domain-containing protein [Denitromonas halophila]
MWIIAGLVLGALAGLDSGLEELIGGAVIGAIIGAVIQFFTRKPKADATALAQLEARVALLEHTVAQLRAGGAERVPTATPVTPPAPVVDEAAPPAFEADHDLRPEPITPTPEPVRRRGADILAARRGEPAPACTAPAERSTGTLDQLYDTARAWLLGGNTVVRVGLLVLFFGLAFLARYAVENSLLPVEFRLAGIAFGGIALLVVGWRLRKQRSGYALSLQGGGVGVLYLTIFAAMRMYEMIPPTLGFALLLAVVVFAAALAVWQNAQALAVIGIAGGFMAPIIASTGQGSHVMLFGYYLLLNAGLLAMAWKKAWRVLNLVGFVFTFSIALAWGAKDYNPALFASTEPFLVAFVLMYIAAAVLYAWRSAPSLKDYVDGTLVFGTPVVGFGLQAALVQDMPYGLAWSALALGGFYVVLARWLHGRARPSLRLLVESFLALGVAFLTLTIPLAVDGQWTAAAWAMEGAALLWVGTRQSRKLAMASGLVLQLAAGAFFVSDGGLEGFDRSWPLFNSQCFGAALIALAGFFSSRFASTGRDHWPRLLTVAAPALLVWATLWWLVGGMAELDVWFNNRQMAAAVLFFFAASGALASLAARRFDWPALQWPALLALPGMAVSLVLTLLHASTHPLADWGLLAWPLAVASALFALRRAEGTPVVAKVLRHGHTAGLWLATLALSWAVGEVVDDAIAGDSWAHAAVLAVVALVMFGVQRLALRGSWPAGPWQQAYLGLGNAGLAVAGLGWALLVSVAGGGDVTPLPYLPLLNPLDLAMGLILLVVFRWWQVQPDGVPALGGALPKVLAAVGFVLANGALLRAVHHLAGVPWSEAALFESDTVQASVSLFWGLLGLALTFIASRGQRRTLWMLGAVLLGVVVAKLFLVDMASTGTVARIVSFLGAGVVLLVVGYFSPLPPAREQNA